ncbi:ABC transporter ATP-binding protein [Cupriavidus sp. DF5525]|uniref:ABC transporter ATP-binding protein n=1 Tax=Cupriavidus sp. DF5525 TaxID=3160989 RepID=UPI0003B0DD5B|nr:hypothetical protein N234_26940 [Ralstonia pickettii DTP0602]
MIIIDDVHKRYRGQHGSHWVLRGVNAKIDTHARVALIGANGAGKSTLLRLIGGIDQPNSGRIIRNCRVSWPLGLTGGLQGSLSGRQNAKFVSRIHGGVADLGNTLEFVQDFSEIGSAFDAPVKTYSSGMRSRLAFAMSLAFRFDTYLVDELTAVGDAAFKSKSRKAFESLIGHAGLIMVSHSESTLRIFCKSAIWLHDGQAHWFDNVDEALSRYRESIKS